MALLVQGTVRTGICVPIPRMQNAFPLTENRMVEDMDMRRPPTDVMGVGRVSVAYSREPCDGQKKC